MSHTYAGMFSFNNVIHNGNYYSANQNSYKIYSQEK